MKAQEVECLANGTTVVLFACFKVTQFHPKLRNPRYRGRFLPTRLTSRSRGAENGRFATVESLDAHNSLLGMDRGCGVGSA